MKKGRRQAAGSQFLGASSADTAVDCEEVEDDIAADEREDVEDDVAASVTVSSMMTSELPATALAFAVPFGPDFLVRISLASGTLLSLNSKPF